MKLRGESYLPGFNHSKVSISHGGDLREGQRKIARALDPKQALHVVLRSSKARGQWSMLTPANARFIHTLTQRLAKRWGVKIHNFANVGSHIHLLIQVPSRLVFQRFLRELSGMIAMAVTGAKKGSGLPRNKNDRGFWDHLAFTRIVYLGRDFREVSKYLFKNLFEAAGVPVKKLLSRGLCIFSTKDIALAGGTPE